MHAEIPYFSESHHFDKPNPMHISSVFRKNRIIISSGQKGPAFQGRITRNCFFLLALSVCFVTLLARTPLNAQVITPQRGGFPALPADNPQIHSVILTMHGSFDVLPILKLGESEGVSLAFDDFDTHPKVYNYTFIRKDENWGPVLLSTFDYLKGFGQGRITQYKYSSLARQSYIHYQIRLPNKECLPVKSGNYLLKVYEAGDTSKLAFCRRVLVVDSKAAVKAEVRLPRNSQQSEGMQKLDLSVDLSLLPVQNPMQQVKVAVLQNARWDNAVHQIQPTFIRGKTYEYNGDQYLLFESGKEYRWMDLRSFRFQSERIQSIDATDQPFKVVAKKDISRTDVQYLPYEDHNGSFQITASESIQPAWQGDYGWVKFRYQPKAVTQQQPGQQQIYLLGQFNQYRRSPGSLMSYNLQKHQYEISVLLKQGYYDYLYAAVPDEHAENDRPAQITGAISTRDTEGGYWETENEYTILVYYQGFADRAPQLVAAISVNSRKK